MGWKAQRWLAVARAIYLSASLFAPDKLMQGLGELLVAIGDEPQSMGLARLMKKLGHRVGPACEPRSSACREASRGMGRLRCAGVGDGVID